jgi:hypothetical protein
MFRGLPILLYQPAELLENVGLYLHMVANPFEGGSPLSPIPATGVAALVLAVGLAMVRREARLWWMLLPVLVSQALVLFAALMIGVSDALLPSMIVFAAAEFVLIGFAIYRCRASRLAGIFGGWFALSYFYVAALDAFLFFVAG